MPFYFYTQYNKQRRHFNKLLFAQNIYFKLYRKRYIFKKNIQQITRLREKSTGKGERIGFEKSSFQQKQGQLVY